MASNATIGNTIIVMILSWYGVSSLASTIGTPTHRAGPYGQSALGQFDVYTIPVTSAAKTITPTLTGSSPQYAIWAMEVPGSVSVSSTPQSKTTSTNPNLTLSVSSGQIAVAMAMGASAATAFSGTPGTWTHTNSGAWLWTGMQDVAYSTNGAASQTVTWTAPSGAWGVIGVVLTQSILFDAPPPLIVRQAANRASMF